MLFSQRQGIIPPFKEFQIEAIDNDLRNRIWNALQVFYWDNFRGRSHQGFADIIKGSNMEGLMFAYWHSFYKLPIDQMPRRFCYALPEIRERFFASLWYQVYDFIEFTIKNGVYDFTKKFPSVYNNILEEENAGYRIVDSLVSPITSEIEIESIEEVIASAETFPGVKTHITTALTLLSDRKNPDYRNTIKESISAVESICQVLTGDHKATLNSALTVLEEHVHLHNAFKAGVSKLYGYTSDANGIRHSMLEENTITFSDAKFMLVTCSAFVNYLIGKTAELEIDLKKGI